MGDIVQVRSKRGANTKFHPDGFFDEGVLSDQDCYSILSSVSKTDSRWFEEVTNEI